MRGKDGVQERDKDERREMEGGGLKRGRKRWVGRQEDEIGCRKEEDGGGRKRRETGQVEE